MPRNQRSLFTADELPPPAVSRDVMAVDVTQVENADRIVDLAALGYLRPPVLDCTWGMGAMWARHDPFGLLVGSDIDPAKARDLVADVHALPFPDGSFESVLFDPPYKTQGGETTGAAEQWETRPFHARYGRAGSLLHDGELWVSGITECCRVSRRHVIVKCQDQVDRTRRVCWQSVDVVLEARRLGWVVQDMLLLLNRGLQPGRTVNQFHARRNYSTFVVLRRPRRMVTSV